MIRTINLKDYLPQYILEYKELNKILSIESKILQNLEATHWQLVDNRFIMTCDESGISRFEKMLNIQPPSFYTLDDRKKKVLSVWNKQLPYNYRYLWEQLTILCGEGNFRIELNDLELKIGVGFYGANMFADVEKMLDATIPCNIVREIEWMYNAYKDAEPFTQFILSKFTHWELKSDPYWEWLSGICDEVSKYRCDEMVKEKYNGNDILTFGVRKKV